MALATANERSGLSRYRLRDALERKIISGAYRPATKLVQPDLAAEYHVSLTVVREALLELRSSGLVDVADNRGFFVARIDRKRLLEAYDVRAALEALSVRGCCDNATRSELRELKDLAEQIHTASIAGQRDLAGSKDREFHLRLMKLSGNELIARLSESHRVLGKIVNFFREPGPVRDEHLALLDAIGRGDAEAAEQIVRAHIGNGRKALEEQPEDVIPNWLDGSES